MIVGFVTDIHVDEKRLDGQDGHGELLTATAQAMAAARCDLILVGGDLAGTQVPHRATPKERNALVAFFLQLAEISPVVIVRGNHDSLGDYSFVQHLSGQHPIYYVEESIEAIEVPGAVVVTMPWLDRGRVASDGRDWGDTVREIYRQSLDDLRSDVAEAQRRGDQVVLLMHAAVPNALIRPGQPMVPTADPTIGLTDLVGDLPVDAIFVGHYHMHQALDAPCPAWYGGSLFVNEYGEDPDKGWLCWNSDTGSAELQIVAQPARVVIRVQDGMVAGVDPPGAIPELEGLSIKDAEIAARSLQLGAHIRIVAKVADHRLEDQAIDVARLRAELAQTSLSMRMDLDVQRAQTMRAGAAEVVKAESTEDKIRHFAGTVSPAPSKAVIDRALQIYAEIQGG